MCGICGKFDRRPEERVDPRLIDRMIGALRHRGPDGSGKFISGQVGLGHTRLSIIDLATGAQPIANEDETIWIVYNGELYNFPELRAQLIANGHRFRTTGDTEVIVHLYEEEGVDCVRRLRGMFAFALWDKRRKQLFCARDRVGIKPFYYWDNGQSFGFASEIKALLTDPDLPREIDLQAIDDFLSFSYIPGEASLFRNVRKLPPGHHLVANANGLVCTRYWDLRFHYDRRWTDLRAAAHVVEQRVESTVADHMLSDVPVGVLLSGGVDSSIVLSCAAQRTAKPVQTFTVGFAGADFADERPFAQMVADLYGAEHHAITLSAEQFGAFLEDYVWHMEEPIYEAPAVALHYVARLARQSVKVVLSGEGGDEAFGGYHNYRNLLLLENVKQLLRPTGSRLLAQLIETAPSVGSLGKLRKYAPLLRQPLESYYYSRRSSPHAYFARERSALYSADFAERTDPLAAARLIARLFHRVRDESMLHRMLYVDTHTWLPDDLLVKADKMTMANSLELRVPFLDHQLLEFAGSLPANFKVRGGATKRVLKAAFARRVPDAILQRKKVGFPVPINRWIRGELKPLVCDVLLSNTSLSRGYFQRRAVEKLVARCMAGQPLTAEVFSLLALELWHRRFVDPAATCDTVPALAAS